ncbi:acyl carrier protein [Qipengyuania sp. CAU 1752]
MDRTSILATITAIIRDELDDETIVLTEQTRASEVDGWDSLAHIRIIVAIESEYGVRFATGDITSLKDVGGLITLVEGHAG